MHDGFFDLHCHFLPGLDDGPVDLEETIATLRMAHDGGTRALAATPHMYLPALHSPPDRVREVFEATTAALRTRAREDPDCAFLAELELELGAENHLSTELLEALDRDEVLTLGGGAGLLLEFGPFHSFETMQSAVRRVVEAGYVPVLAHVERYRPLLHDPDRLRRLTAMGCHAQVNADSVLGPPESQIRRGVLALLEAGIATIVASDLHGVDRRPSRLGAAARELGSRFPSGRVGAWMRDNPRRLVQETPVSSR